MPLLLIDDRDGRILEMLETEEQVRRALEALVSEDQEVPEYLSLVECGYTRGSFFATDTSVTFRTLT